MNAPERMFQRPDPFRVVRDFEQALCDYTGAPYAVTTTSCTMALTLALAYHLQPRAYEDLLQNRLPPVEIPKRTYVGVAYAIREAGGEPTFRDEDWTGWYQLKPYPVWDSARWLSSGMYLKESAQRGQMVCVSFHWAKTLGIQQGGAILHDDPTADAWLRRARFDGRAEGVAPLADTFPLKRAWHAYMSPEVAAEGVVRLANLPAHNAPIPKDAYPDLSRLAAFQ